jgi:hypothetical protein
MWRWSATPSPVVVQAVLDAVVSLGVRDVAVVSNSLTSLLHLSRLVEDLQARDVQARHPLLFVTVTCIGAPTVLCTVESPNSSIYRSPNGSCVERSL